MLKIRHLQGIDHKIDLHRLHDSTSVLSHQQLPITGLYGSAEACQCVV